MNQAKLEALLGRPLTPTEQTNQRLYLKIARESLEGLICTTVSCESEEARAYNVREGYSTAFVDIFTELTEVKIDGTVIDPSKYSVRQWDKRSGSWYNAIVLNRKFRNCDREIEVTASWGFDSMPVDLQLLMARIFDHVGRQNSLDREINSKKVEDFTISYNHSSITMSDTLWASLVQDNATTISKYSMCDIPNVQHGRVC